MIIEYPAAIVGLNVFLFRIANKLIAYVWLILCSKLNWISETLKLCNTHIKTDQNADQYYLVSCTRQKKVILKFWYQYLSIGWM